MSLICNVCAQEKEKFEVPNRVSSSNIDELLEKLTSLNWTLGLEQCEFENHSSPTTSLFWKESSTEQIYHTLSQWTGGCSA
jgi:TATA-box binding protein (TBP) (component of TFIID and TFIIIB)